jgi:DNA-binding transcriptional regulator YdaS (Cro superfamily)
MLRLRQIGEKMNQFKELQMEFGSLASIASKLGVRESAIYQWVARKQIPLKHIKTLIILSEGRLTKEMLRPDLFKKD